MYDIFLHKILIYVVRGIPITIAYTNVGSDGALYCTKVVLMDGPIIYVPGHLPADATHLLLSPCQPVVHVSVNELVL